MKRSPKMKVIMYNEFCKWNFKCILHLEEVQKPHQWKGIS